TSIWRSLKRSDQSPEASLPRNPWIEWLVPLLSSLIAATTALIIGRRYAFETRRLWLWTSLGFLLGPLGVAVMVALLEWPARETCPSCGRKRVVTRAECPHCGAAFRAPAPDGTEIFEAINYSSG